MKLLDNVFRKFNFFRNFEEKRNFLYPLTYTRL